MNGKDPKMPFVDKDGQEYPYILYCSICSKQIGFSKEQNEKAKCFNCRTKEKWHQ